MSLIAQGWRRRAGETDVKKLGSLLDWVLPESWRRRPAARPWANDSVVARLSDADPVYRALMDRAVGQLEDHMIMALERDLSPERRAYHCGQAASLVQFVVGIENWREQAKKFEQKRTK